MGRQNAAGAEDSIEAEQPLDNASDDVNMESPVTQLEETEDSVEHDAAVTIQAVQRGRQARKQMQAENDAAVKIQAVQRGRMTRAELAAKREDDGGTTVGTIGEDEGPEDAEHGIVMDYNEEAVVKIQAVQRGRKARAEVQALRSGQTGQAGDEEPTESQGPGPDVQLEDYDEEAVVKIQAVQRGRKARAKVDRLKEAQSHVAESGGDAENGDEELESGYDDYDEEAVVKIQAVQRGRKARAEVEALRSGQQTGQPETERPEPDETFDDYDEEAVVKIQAMQRGRKARAEVEALRSGQTGQPETEEPMPGVQFDDYDEEAVVKIQAVQRGRKARAEAEALRSGQTGQPETERPEPDEQFDDYDEEAVVKIQAVQRGRKARAEVEALRSGQQTGHPETERPEPDETFDDYDEEAVVKIQAVQRGRKARAKADQLRKAQSHVAESGGDTANGDEEFEPGYDDYDEEAVIKIQAIQRGRKVRAELDAELEALRSGQTGEDGDERQPENEQQDPGILFDEYDEEAVVKIQAMQRGRKARTKVDQLRSAQSHVAESGGDAENGDEDLDPGYDDYDEEAVVKIQAIHRGRKARAEVEALRSGQTGQAEHEDYAEAEDYEDEFDYDYDEAAVVKIQAMQRGRMARAEMEAIRSEELPSVSERVGTPPARRRVSLSDDDVDSPARTVSDPDVMRDSLPGTEAYRGKMKRNKSKLFTLDEHQELPAEALQEDLDDSHVLFGSEQEIPDVGLSDPPVNDGEDDAADDTEAILAATRIQAAERGRKSRKEVAKLREARQQEELQQQEEAATRIQAAQRGRLARKRVPEMRRQREEENSAALAIQAAERGRQTRKALKLEKQNKAATKIQCAQRSKAARQRVEELREERMDFEVIAMHADCDAEWNVLEVFSNAKISTVGSKRRYLAFHTPPVEPCLIFCLCCAGHRAWTQGA